MYTGRLINIETSGVLGDDGVWKIQLTVTHKRTNDPKTPSKEWEQKSSSVMVYDNSFDKAVNIANDSMYRFLEQLKFDLFSEDTNGENNSTENTKS